MHLHGTVGAHGSEAHDTATEDLHGGGQRDDQRVTHKEENFIGGDFLEAHEAVLSSHPTWSLATPASRTAPYHRSPKSIPA
jgi:hypothetical protein